MAQRAALKKLLGITERVAQVADLMAPGAAPSDAFVGAGQDKIYVSGCSCVGRGAEYVFAALDLLIRPQPARSFSLFPGPPTPKINPPLPQVAAANKQGAALPSASVLVGGSKPAALNFTGPHVAPCTSTNEEGAEVTEMCSGGVVSVNAQYYEVGPVGGGIPDFS